MGGNQSENNDFFLIQTRNIYLVPTWYLKPVLLSHFYSFTRILSQYSNLIIHSIYCKLNIKTGNKPAGLFLKKSLNYRKLTVFLITVFLICQLPIGNYVSPNFNNDLTNMTFFSLVIMIKFWFLAMIKIGEA